MELLRLEHITHATERKDSLYNVSLTLDKGDNVVIFGPEHSGINLINMVILGFEIPVDGKVIYKGRSIHEFDYVENHNYKREIGYIHGDYGLISNMTVVDNISLPLEYHSTLSSKEIDNIVDEILEDFNLGHCKNLRPIDLSSSEILRTAYARSIINDPQILIVDQALEGHSMLNISTFLANLMERCKDPNRAHLFLTYHPQNFLDFADKYIMLYNGRVVFEGTKQDFIYTDNPYLIQYRTASLDGPMNIQ